MTSQANHNSLNPSSPNELVSEEDLSNTYISVDRAMSNIRNGSALVRNTRQQVYEPTFLGQSDPNLDLRFESLNPVFQPDHIDYGASVDHRIDTFPPRQRWLFLLHRDMFRYMCRCFCDMLLLPCRDIMSLLYAYYRLVYSKREISRTRSRTFYFLFYPNPSECRNLLVNDRFKHLRKDLIKLRPHCSFDTLCLTNNLSMLVVSASQAEITEKLARVMSFDICLCGRLVLEYLSSSSNNRLPSYTLLGENGIVPSPANVEQVEGCQVSLSWYNTRTSNPRTSITLIRAIEVVKCGELRQSPHALLLEPYNDSYRVR
jgi:hypothetical protein